MDELRTKAESYVQKFFSLCRLPIFLSLRRTFSPFSSSIMHLSPQLLFAERRFKNITSFLSDVCMHPAPSDTMHTRKASVAFVANTNNKSVHNGFFSQPACHFP
jgi:hypothetical protein